MPVKIAVLKETRSHERRVAMVPAVADKLAKLGAQIHLQAGAGAAVKLADAAYKNVQLHADPIAMVSDADIVLSVQPPGSADRAGNEGRRDPDFLRVRAQGTRADPSGARPEHHDVRDGAGAAHHARAGDGRAVEPGGARRVLRGLLGATSIARMLPMMTTAVGSLKPAMTLVMGLGVAGLQALATARRLGSRTEGYDVRPETKEQAESLGARFVDTGVDARGAGGYARELTQEEKEKVAAVITKHIQQADLVITTAAIPGRPSPKLISKAQVEGMKAGSVIVDLAAEGGGNCELTKPGETVQVGQVTIVAPLNVPSLLGEHASELYAKNQLNLLELFVKDGALKLDWSDEVLAKTVLTHGGEIKNEAAKKAVEG
jgi:NAD(P) transhydrogenase subunit alpha